MTAYSADTIALSDTTVSGSVDDPSLYRRWRLVSFLVSLGMFAFLLGQSFMTLRDQGGITYLPDLIVFPGFAIGTAMLLLAGCSSAIHGIRRKLSTNLGLALLGGLTCLSLFRGHYNSVVAVREALFSPTGIGVWIAFLLLLPGQNKGFWVYFKRHLLIIYKLSLVLQVLAIVLLLSGNRGLVRVNFSTSISLFILGWGILDANKSLVRWGWMGLLLFGCHSVLINQRETFLLPPEFLALLVPIYFGRSIPGRERPLFGKLFKFFVLGCLLVVIVPVLYFSLPTKQQQVFGEANLIADTRTLVLRDYMSSDMTRPVNCLFGKGVNGFYRSKVRSSAIGGRGTSTGIEVGYLQMIVNVGTIYTIIMVLMGFIPAIRVFLKSRDSLVITSGLWVLVRLINMTVAALPRTEFPWFLFWICIGVLSSRETLKGDVIVPPEAVR